MLMTNEPHMVASLEEVAMVFDQYEVVNAGVDSQQGQAIGSLNLIDLLKNGSADVPAPGNSAPRSSEGSTSPSLGPFLLRYVFPSEYVGSLDSGRTLPSANRKPEHTGFPEESGRTLPPANRKPEHTGFPEESGRTLPPANRKPEHNGSPGESVSIGQSILQKLFSQSVGDSAPIPPSVQHENNGRSQSPEVLPSVIGELSSKLKEAVEAKDAKPDKDKPAQLLIYEVPVHKFNKAEVTPESIKQAKEKMEKEIKKDPPPEGTAEMVNSIVDGILSGDPATIQKMLKNVKTPEDVQNLQKAAEYVGKRLGVLALAGQTHDGKPYFQMRTFFEHENLTGSWENEVQMYVYPDSVSTSMKSNAPIAGEDRPRLKKVDPKIIADYLQKGFVNKR